MAKGLDSTFLHYGVRNDDMAIIEQSCRENVIGPEWIKEHFLKVYNARRNEGELKDLAIAEAQCFINENRNLTEGEKTNLLNDCHGKKGDFGYVFQDGNDFYIVINFQIRFR